MYKWEGKVLRSGTINMLGERNRDLSLSVREVPRKDYFKDKGYRVSVLQRESTHE